MLLCLFLGLCLFNVRTALAQDDDDIDIEVYDDDEGGDEDEEYYEEDDDEDDGVVGEHGDVLTSHVFPRIDGTSIKAGEPVQSLIGFSNDADEPFNVTLIGGSLRSIYDNEYYVQNFSSISPGVVVPTSTDVSFSFYYMPQDLEAVDFQLDIWVQYNDSFGKTYRNTVYNQTVSLEAASAEFDTMTALSFLATVFGLFITTKFLAPESAVAKLGQSSRVERGTNDTEDWDVKTYSQKTKAGSTKKKKSSKKGRKGKK